MDKVQIIPSPKDVDPRVLMWKGAAVLGKMDGVAELWITPSDWVRAFLERRRLFTERAWLDTQDLLGMRGLRERCFYL